MISIALIGPENAGNVGAVARVMKNFDFRNLILIDPKCDHLSKDALDRASHARDILKKAKIADISVISSFDVAVATTSKIGTDYNIPRSPIDPKQFAEKLSEAGGKNRIVIVFGRESHGLSNEEVNLCDFVVSIPSSSDYPALNLSHSVAVILYEIYSLLGKKKISSNIPLIGEEEKKQLFRMIDDMLDRLEFATKEKKETQRRLWRRMVTKSFMTKREAFALMGFLNKVK
ncbi:MAG: RNA methyltransferase [Candidatus Woesearchaeota archaeon]|nr:RNA methyltransferase [Candidatus Woesearchaeota archaeon]